MSKKQNTLAEAFFTAIRPIWMFIRKLSPKGTYIRLGDYWIKDPDTPKIDRIFPRTRHKRDDPHYEQNSISAIRKYVKQGHRVTIIGGGYGVTGIVAMEKGGLVTLIEPSKKRVENILKTWNEHNMDGKIIQGYVGAPLNIWGEMEGAEKIEVIPECDVLELDCEGGEKEVLFNLSINPEIIIVESHGHLGSPSFLVKELLNRKGYIIIDEQPEEVLKDMMVITARRKDH